MKNLTIRALGRRFGLSRSTLLYYDHIGLLRPSARSSVGYRLYSERDAARLARLVVYRDAGLALDSIRQLLDAPEDRSRELLTGRLREINSEIHQLRGQQRVLVRLLGDGGLVHACAMTKTAWIALLRATGLSEHDMARWHREFEQRAPEAHQDFLASLGIPAEEVEAIRAWSRSGGE